MTDPKITVTDEMVERAGRAIADEFGYALYSREEMYDAAYWKRLAQGALEAALEVPE